MRSHLVLWLVATFILTGCAGIGIAEDAKPEQLPPARATAVKAVDKITIDGKLDEETWKKAERLPIEIVHNAGVKGQPAGWGRMAHDDENFYIAFELVDGDIRAKGDARDNADIIPPNDVVEVFIDINNDDEHFLELHLNPLNGFNDVFIVRPRKESPLYGRLMFNLMFIQGWNMPEYETAVHVDGTVNLDADDDRGWTAEIRLPFKSLMMPLGQKQPKPDDEWRVQLVVQNGLSQHRYIEWSPNYDAWFHHSIANWGRVKFGQ